MTSWVKAYVNGRFVIFKVGGYTGKTESEDPVEDIMTANRAWLSAQQGRYLGLKIGKKVKVRIGNRTVKGKVLRWSRGSYQILFDRPLGLTRREAKKVRVDVD